MTAVLRWLLMSATFTLVHGSLRVGGAAGTARPGVPLAAVLNLSSGRCRVFSSYYHGVPELLSALECAA